MAKDSLQLMVKDLRLRKLIKDDMLYLYTLYQLSVLF